jgi:hypothetical protein
VKSKKDRVDMFEIFKDIHRYDRKEHARHKKALQAQQERYRQVPDKFVCLALQHKTQDYIATVKEQPQQAVFVEAFSEKSNFDQEPSSIPDHILNKLKVPFNRSQTMTFSSPKAKNDMILQMSAALR